MSTALPPSEGSVFFSVKRALISIRRKVVPIQGSCVGLAQGKQQLLVSCPQGGTDTETSLVDDSYTS